MSFLENTLETHKNILQNDIIKSSLFIMSGMFLTFTFKPIPDKIRKYINSSDSLKLFIILFCACLISYPITFNSLLYIGIGAVVGILISKKLLNTEFSNKLIDSKSMDRLIQSQQKEIDTLTEQAYKKLVTKN